MPSCSLLSPPLFELVRSGFMELLPLDDRVDPRLRGAVADTLEHPGALVRAQLAYGIMRELDVEPMQALSGAVGIEYLHSASLILDDMPGMDDARERRGRPCPHVTYGEGPAMLGALAFINQGYALLWEVLASLDRKRRTAGARLVSSCLGVNGILNGQARDLRFDGTRRREADVLKVAEGKTVALIRLTLLFPAIVGGATEVALAKLERLSYVWGLSYQILDDFKDCVMSREETGKTTSMDRRRGRPNLPATVGQRRAMLRLSSLLDEGRSVLGFFPESGGRWRQLHGLQSLLEDERDKVERRIAVPA